MLTSAKAVDREAILKEAIGWAGTKERGILQTTGYHCQAGVGRAMLTVSVEEGSGEVVEVLRPNGSMMETGTQQSSHEEQKSLAWMFNIECLLCPLWARLYRKI